MAAPDAQAPEIADEAREVARILEAVLVEGDEATSSKLRSLAPGARVVHLATHGIYEPDEPLLSGLKFADGRLTVPEMASLGLDAALVTLSACQSAVGTSRGDELVGLVRTFLQAGARSVVASLWQVQDASTARLMGSFYEGLARGDRVTAALRRAMLQLREDRPHPWHWAPFLVAGGWQGIRE